MLSLQLNKAFAKKTNNNNNNKMHTVPTLWDSEGEVPNFSIEFHRNGKKIDRFVLTNSKLPRTWDTDIFAEDRLPSK